MILDTLIYSALSLKGLSYSSDPARYSATLFPHDTPAEQLRLGRAKITCSLTCCAVLRLAGVDGSGTQYGSLLGEPFGKHDGQSMPFLEALGRHHGLWVPASPRAVPPAAGDMIIIGAGLSTHAIALTGQDGDTYETVEGGQPDGGNGGACTAIRQKSRRLENRRGVLWMLDAAAAVGAGGRQVYGWLRASELPSL